MKKRGSIKKDIFASALLVASLIMAISIALLSFSSYNTLIDNAHLRLEKENSVISTYVEGIIREATNVVDVVSLNENVIKGNTSSYAEVVTLEIFDQYRSTNEDILYMYSGYEGGDFIIGDYDTPEDFDPRVRPWYISSKLKRDR